jgi:hypothetical protein
MLSVQKDNTLFPDSEALYFEQPIVASANTQIVLSGDFPDARYAALSVYLPSGGPFTSNSVGSSLPDYRIAADPGSTNPWQHTSAPGGRFTVTIRSQVSSGQTNVLPMPPGTTSGHPGFLGYRIYLPAGGISAPVQLPTLTIHDGQATRQLSTCQNQNAPVPTPVRSPTPTPTGVAPPTPPQLKFYKPAGGFSVNAELPNVDSSYALAYFVRPASADVAVVTGKAPTSPPGGHPAPWPNPNTDMRYWSMCMATGTVHLPLVANTLPSGQSDYGCRADDQTARNAAGDYTYVIGAESQRSAIDAIPGVTFLPFTTNQPATPVYVLMLRNTLVNPAFPYSTANVTQASDPSATAAAMGPYYPNISVCALTAVTASGCSS